MSRHGWRWFDLGRDGSLRSVNGIIWPPNEPLAARCEFGKSDHPVAAVPDLECGCGCWAFYDPEDAWSLQAGWGYFANAKVFGIIEAWGGIVEHEHGFRAQYAEVRAVYIQRGWLHACYSDVIRYPNPEQLLRVWDIGTQEALY